MTEGPERSDRRLAWMMAAALLLVVVSLGAFAVRLNRIYYAHNTPIYDSMSYTCTMVLVAGDAQTLGPLRAVQNVRGSTVVLPWIETALLARVLPMDRAAGVWLQTIWLAPLALSIFFFFHRLRKCDAVSSFAATLPFLAPAMMFRYNGGLSDFRMDLGLYQFYALAGVWYLATHYTDRVYPWVLCGIAMGLACLARATAPMYFAVGLGPLWIARLIIEKRRGRLVGSMTLATVLAAGIGLWFLVLHYDFLRYYYLEWNFDANVQYPLLQSLRHVRYGLRHVGIVAGIFGLIFLARRFGILMQMARGTYELPLGTLVTRLDFEALWLGVAPLAMLVLRGAGDNPHVSMPAAFGLAMFMLFPHRGEETYQPVSRRGPLVTAALALAMLITNATAGIPQHVRGYPFSSRRAHAETIDRVFADAKANNVKQITFAVGYEFYFLPQAVFNMLLFDYGFSPVANDGLTKDGVTFRIDRAYGVSTPVEWNRLAGASDEERIQTLADRAAESVEYLVLPDEKTAAFLETDAAASIGQFNRRARRIRERILSRGNWQPLGEPLRNNADEVLVVYANRQLVRGVNLATMPVSTQGEP